MTPDEIQLNQQVIFWSEIAAIATSLGVIVALFLPFLQKHLTKMSEQQNAIKRISFELAQLLQTLSIAVSLPQQTVFIRDGVKYFNYKSAIQNNIYFQLVDHVASINIILENMQKLSGSKFQEMFEIIIILKNLFSGSERKYIEFRKTFDDIILFIKDNNKEISWVNTLDNLNKGDD